MSDRTATEEHYVGDELELFRHCTNWKQYFTARIAPFLRGRVLEVGAGLGGTTLILGQGHQGGWLCLEPDLEMVRQLEERRDRGELPPGCDVRGGVLRDLPDSEQFDTILYVDVLEHIEEDRQELQQAGRHLTPTGQVVVLSPAYQWLYSPFDRAIGHYRRYSKASLSQVIPEDLKFVKLRYLDSVGVLASSANRFLMKQGMPTPEQLKFWDRCLVPLSKVVDWLTAYSFGKSILAVLARRDQGGES
jgi:SAM-dependent methyltransferase